MRLLATVIQLDANTNSFKSNSSCLVVFLEYFGVDRICQELYSTIGGNMVIYGFLNIRLSENYEKITYTDTPVRTFYS